MTRSRNERPEPESPYVAPVLRLHWDQTQPEIVFFILSGRLRLRGFHVTISVCPKQGDPIRELSFKIDRSRADYVFKDKVAVTASDSRSSALAGSVLADPVELDGDYYLGSLRVTGQESGDELSIKIDEQNSNLFGPSGQCSRFDWVSEFNPKF